MNVKVNVQTTGKSSARRTPNFPVSPLKAEKEEKGVKKNKEGRKGGEEASEPRRLSWDSASESFRSRGRETLDTRFTINTYTHFKSPIWSH